MFFTPFDIIVKMMFKFVYLSTLIFASTDNIILLSLYF